jgi:hypothetical protein
MDRLAIVREFNRLYLGDSLLQHVVLDIGAAECRLGFDAARVLVAEGASIFEPEASFAPAWLRLVAVRSVRCEGGRYQLNSTVVDFGAAPHGDGDGIAFWFALTGGADPDGFLVTVTIVAASFQLGPATA